MSILYATLTFAAVSGFAMLAVDVGLLQLTRAEAQTGADAIGRYAATGFVVGTTTEIRARATAAAADVRVAGQAISFNSAQDIEFGVWDAQLRTFAVLPAGQEGSATAIRSSVRMTRTRSKSIPLYMARVFGINDTEITGSAVVARGKTVAPVVYGTSCPWMAGMTSSAVVAATGGNPQPITGSQYLPVQVNLSTFTSSSPLRFRQGQGTTSMTGYNDMTMDGESTWIVRQPAANGINATSAPLGALMGIFLDDRAPNTYAAAAEPDFSTWSSRNQSSYSPALKQVFFIGDGLTDSGQLQDFVPPAGATRLYLGIMDENGWWWDNTGSVTTNLLDSKITLVK